MSIEMISGLLEKSRELDNVRQKQDELLGDINRIHKKLQTGEIRELPLFSIFFFFAILVDVCLISASIVLILGYYDALFA